jgi:hypothetical protein
MYGEMHFVGPFPAIRLPDYASVSGLARSDSQMT